MDQIELDQKRVCSELGVALFSSPPGVIAGVADDVFQGVLPINGLRHPPIGGTSGWYIWAGGEPGGAADYFKPTHVAHILEEIPMVVAFLGLPPGYRFLTDGSYKDIWFDPELLIVQEN